MSDGLNLVQEPSGESDDANYEVGYRKPPRQHRFQPGNQAARKKKRAAEKTIPLSETIGEALRRSVKVRKGEKVINVSVQEVFIERLVQGMTRGSTRDMIKIFELIQQHAPDLLSVDPQVLEIVYRRAEGSTVPLPPTELYDLVGESK